MAKPKNFHINARTVTAPIAAFTMAGLLFVYSRTLIQAAKRNAQQHREADGGQISWQNESLRRHGVIDKPGENGIVRELFGQAKQETVRVVRQGTEEEEKIRALAQRGKENR